MKKIIVIGSPGAGKNVFSKKLNKLSKLPLYHLDLIWHKVDKTTISRNKFDKKLNKILKQDVGIIDGNYLRTLERRLKWCDTVFLLDYPLELNLEGALSRIGKKRSDFPYIEEEFDQEFKEWIINFKEDQLIPIYQLLEKYQEKRIIIFKSRKNTKQYLEDLWRKT